MQPLQDDSAFEWIRIVRDRLSREKPRPDLNWPGIFVSDIMPEGFESYATILHRFDANYDEIDNPLSPSEHAILRIGDCEPLRSFIIQRRTASSSPRIRWKELAALFDVPYVPEISLMWFRRRMDSWCVSRLLNLFTDAWPAGDECEEVCTILSKFTGREDCFFRLPSYYEYTHANQPMFYRGRLPEVTTFLRARPKRTVFEYWWPSDQRWCFCCETDIGATVVGGPKDLISALLASSQLECIEVQPTTRVDNRVPIPDPPSLTKT